jgi:hypothetical protein
MRLADEIRYRSIGAGGPGSGRHKEYENIAIKHGYDHKRDGIFKDYYSHPDFHDLRVWKHGKKAGQWAYGREEAPRKTGNSPEELDKYLGGIKKLGQMNPTYFDYDSPRRLLEQVKDARLQHPD